MTKDKRRFERREAHLEVELGFPSGELQVVRTRDVSDGGVFLLVDKLRRPVIGEVVTVKLNDNNTHNKDVAFPSNDAVVVRQEEGGIGLAFIELDFNEDY